VFSRSSLSVRCPSTHQELETPTVQLEFPRDLAQPESVHIDAARRAGEESELILVIEDDPDCRTELRLLMEEQGYRVLQAPDARTGLQLAELHAPGLIIQDLLLPDTHGFDLVAQLRALPNIGRLPIIALSAFPDRLTEAQAHALGFTRCLRKPPVVSELCDLVRTLLGRPR
jgi:DNA-binding response OmpR family regulator